MTLRPPTATPDEPEVTLEQIGHPRGTLAIVILFGLLFALGWIAFYYFGFMRRGLPQP